VSEVGVEIRRMSRKTPTRILNCWFWRRQ